MRYTQSLSILETYSQEKMPCFSSGLFKLCKVTGSLVYMVLVFPVKNNFKISLLLMWEVFFSERNILS